MKILNVLEGLGFEGVVTLTDGNEVNHKFFQDILMSKVLQDSIRNPFNDSHLIFLGCFYTNFINRKVFIFPKFRNREVLLEDRFADLMVLYEMKLGKPLRKAYMLSDKVLAPTNIEWPNVMLAINALRYYGSNC